MKNRNTPRKALLLSALSIVMCILLLVGSTFAWFTDSVVSSGNQIQSGTLTVDLELLGKADGLWHSIKEGQDTLFNNTRWEPGFTEVKLLKISNKGNLSLNWVAKFVSSDDLSELADVIDVYVLPYGKLEDASSVAYPADRNLDGYTNVGTLAHFIETLDETTYGFLKEGESAYLGIALKMQETAGNEYQDLDLGGVFDIKILASQATFEEDVYDDQYDVDAPSNYVPISNVNELKLALRNHEENIVLTSNCYTDEMLVVDYDVNIDGAGYVLARKADAVSVIAEDEQPAIYTGTIITVAPNTTLTLENIIVDGGAVWTGEVHPVLNRGVDNAGLVTTSSLVVTQTNSQIILGEGAVLQNNDGAVAVNLDTRIGATLVLDGGKIINNHSNAGAIWGGGHITINSGSIGYNSSSGIAGAIRMVGNCNLTMNGGEIHNNVAVTNGGAIYGYGASTYNLTGGKIHSNSAALGGALYTGNGSVVSISGDFEMYNNTATQAGAMRLDGGTSIIMGGGKIYGNTSIENENWSGFYGWNPGVNIYSGELYDNITIHGGVIPTLGGDGINGIVHFALSTNHNTVNLKSSFGTIRFTVAEGNNFNAFHFKPADDYSYTEGDEAKLICMNEGYITYYDTATGTFRLQTN